MRGKIWHGYAVRLHGIFFKALALNLSTSPSVTTVLKYGLHQIFGDDCVETERTLYQRFDAKKASFRIGQAGENASLISGSYTMACMSARSGLRDGQRLKAVVLQKLAGFQPLTPKACVLPNSLKIYLHNHPLLMDDALLGKSCAIAVFRFVLMASS